MREWQKKYYADRRRGLVETRSKAREAAREAARIRKEERRAKILACRQEKPDPKPRQPSRFRGGSWQGDNACACTIVRTEDIERALEANGRILARAASALGITVSTVRAHKHKSSRPELFCTSVAKHRKFDRKFETQDIVRALDESITLKEAERRLGCARGVFLSRLEPEVISAIRNLEARRALVPSIVYAEREKSAKKKSARAELRARFTSEFSSGAESRSAFVRRASSAGLCNVDIGGIIGVSREAVRLILLGQLKDPLPVGYVTRAEADEKERVFAALRVADSQVAHQFSRRCDRSRVAARRIASRILGVSYRTLNRRLHKYGVL